MAATRLDETFSERGPWPSGGTGRAAWWKQSSYVSASRAGRRANLAFVCNPSAKHAMRFLDFEGRESYDHRMMLRAWLAIVVLATSVGSVQAQSLADVARTEAARRKTTETPSKVYTNDDLRSDFTKPAAPAPAASTDAAPSTEASADAGGAKPAAAGAAAGAQVKDQAYWSERLAEARSKLERSQSFAQALQNRVDMLWTDFVNRGDPVQQRAIEQERNKALAELERLKKEIDENQKAVTAVEDEARRAGVPAGWLRP